MEGQVRGDRVTLRIREFSPIEEAEKADLLRSLPFVQEVIINSAQGNSLNLVVTPQNDALITIQSLNSAGLPRLALPSRPEMMSTLLLRAADTELAAVGDHIEG